MSKKNFKDNPALNFISGPARKPAPIETARPAEGPPMKPNPLYLETRSRRLQLLLQPSLHQKLTLRAQQNGRSLNDLIHSILSDWADRPQG